LNKHGSQKKKEYLGVEPPFLGFEAEAIKNFTGKIPKLPEAVPPQQNPLTYWCKYKGGNTPTTTYLENTPGKIYWVHHIYLSIWGMGNVYAVSIQDKNGGNVYMLFIDVGDTENIDLEFSVPLKFEDMVRVDITGLGAGDAFFTQMVGYVQNKA